MIAVGYGRDGDTVYLHGSAESQSLRAAPDSEVCLNVIHLDGIVYARSLFRHTLNYRSAMIYGRPSAVTGREDKLAALEVVAGSMAPGRWDVARRPNDAELANVTDRRPPG